MKDSINIKEPNKRINALIEPQPLIRHRIEGFATTSEIVGRLFERRI